MGRDKAMLTFGTETGTARVARILAGVVDEVVLAGRRDQTLPAEYATVHDQVESQGPLAALANGLGACTAERVFLASCDMPMLRPEFVRRVFELGGDEPIAVPVDASGHIAPIGGVYRREVLGTAQDLLGRGERKLAALARAYESRLIEPAELADVDPELESLMSVNTPEEYDFALGLVHAREA